MTLLTLSAIWKIVIALSCPTKSLTTHILCEIKVGANEKFSNLLGFRKKENTARKDFVSICPSHSLTSASSPLSYLNLCVPVSRWSKSLLVCCTLVISFSSPVQTSPVQSSPVQSSPVQSNSVLSSPVQFSSVQSSSVHFTSVHFSSIYYYFYCNLNLVVPIDYCYLVRRRFNRKHSSCPAPWFGGVT